MRFKLFDYDICSFCQDLAGERECAYIAENELAAAEVNERQYERGAMLVIPRTHRESILDIEPVKLAAVYRLMREVARAAAAAFAAHGMNVFQNNGAKGAQTEPHFHVHVVPRYESSDPHRRFLQRDYRILSIEEQREIAATIRRCMERW
jgi:histidine triad (HIT) family protein